ncbi:diguanylate cyclase [Duganella sp. FT135W]|uniref:diguanylate cyclase n=1 Tax=Duganella flavida TaxID=2692175 RepID=A0A6L8KCX9_9BURK|nr:tetratricopeptide repeat-containing diguanylate cyclase [Duganella flavida]MYM24920.1 diguanylate cyclase [Duganella flavida]
MKLRISLLLSGLLATAAAWAADTPFERCISLSATNPAAALKQVQDELPQQKDAAAIAGLRLCRGHALLLSGKREQAVDEFQFAVSEAERLRDNSLLAAALLLRGEQRGYDGQYADAIADLKRGYELMVQRGDVLNQNYALNAIANLYADSNVKDYEQALQYYRKLLIAHLAKGAEQDTATTYFNIASTLEKMEQLPAAQEQFEQALAIDHKRNVGSDIAYDERALAVVLSKRGQHEAALRLLDHALQQYRSDQDEEGVATVQLSRGAALRRAGRNAAALADLDAARTYFQQHDNLRYLDKIYEELGLAQAGNGNWHEAYIARGEQMRVKQALEKQLLDERSSRLRVQFHTEQAQRNNASLASALEAADTIRRWQYAALVLSLLAIAALGVMMKRQIAQARRMRDLALTDELTRLPNRRHFLELAHTALAQAQRDHTPLAFAALDIDHFKRINDTYGHAVGDVVLQRISHAARVALRPGDVIGRIGGEEFLVLLRGTTLEQAMGAAERIRAAVAEVDCRDQAPELKPSISIGVAAYDALAGTLELICKRADDALYRAKANGRNRVEAALA